MVAGRIRAVYITRFKPINHCLVVYHFTPEANGDLVFALSVGFAPSTLLGIPGLIGLAIAVLARVAFGAYLKHNRKTIANGAFSATQQLTEVCFYLAA